MPVILSSGQSAWAARSNMASMIGDDPNYVDPEAPTVAACLRCRMDVAGSRSGSQDARYIIKALKAHIDETHFDWARHFGFEISAAIARLNAGAANPVACNGRFGFRTFGTPI